MREMGYTDFHRRVLYRRCERGRVTAGWIERFGWDKLRIRNAERGVRNEEERNTDEHRKERISTDPTIIPHSEFRTPHSNVPHSAIRTPHSKRPRYTAGEAAAVDGEFPAFLERVSPKMDWNARHLTIIRKALLKVTLGITKRLIINLPPRHGKSSLVTVRYSAWRLKRNPAERVILAGYNQKLADHFSRKVRGVLADDWALEESCRVTESQSTGAAKTNSGNSANSANSGNSPNSAASQLRNSVDSTICPFPFITARPKNSESEWETTLGGGLKAVGVGAGVTGFGANLIVIDDPVKSRAEAESQSYRDRVWEWFNDDVYTRLEPDGAVILIQTRWHEDDLAGRLIRQMNNGEGEHWEIISLPALEEEVPNDSAMRNEECGVRIKEEWNTDEHRKERINTDPTIIPHSEFCTPHSNVPHSEFRDPHSPTALWPERYSVAALEAIRKQLGTYSFAALYQQRPVPAEGGMFKRAWFTQAVPYAPPGLTWARGYDLGISARSTSDFTASFRVGRAKNGDLYIDGGFRRRMEYPEQRRFILGRIAAEPDTRHGIELSANGHAVIQDLRRNPASLGRSLRGVKPRGDKFSRALGWMALAEAGKVFLVRGHWNRDFVDEAASFPQGTHDDQIDAVSIAVQLLGSAGGQAFGF